MNPPANAQPSNVIGNEDGDDSVQRPVVGDPHMAKVVGCEDELMPEQAKEEGTNLEVPVPVGIYGKDSKEGVAQDLWTVAGEIGGRVQSSVNDAFVQLLVRFGMASLGCRGKV